MKKLTIIGSLAALPLVMGAETTSYFDRTAAYEMVTYAQAALSREGIYKGKIDGVCGPETEAALRRYWLDTTKQSDGDCGIVLFADDSLSDKYGTSLARELGIRVVEESDVTEVSKKCGGGSYVKTLVGKIRSPIYGFIMTNLDWAISSFDDPAEKKEQRDVRVCIANALR
jgi:hypothetical protein